MVVMMATATTTTAIALLQTYRFPFALQPHLSSSQPPTTFSISNERQTPATAPANARSNAPYLRRMLQKDSEGKTQAYRASART